MAMTQMTSDLVAYKIGAARCTLRIGDLVKPGTEIGEDCDTGELLYARTCGQVEGIYFSGTDHALIVIIRVQV